MTNHRSPLWLIGLGLLAVSCASKPKEPKLFWVPLMPSLPDTPGYAGMYAGEAPTALLAAGGANFPDAPPWAGGKKVWSDKVYSFDKTIGKKLLAGGLLTNPTSLQSNPPPATNEADAAELWQDYKNLVTQTWRVAGKLPRPLGYGVSASWDGGMVCVGGNDANGASADAFIIRLDSAGAVVVENLPRLPEPMSDGCGVRIGSTLYVAGGVSGPNATIASSRFLALDLAALPAERKWIDLPTWPGPERMQAVAATGFGADTFYLFGGIRLARGDDGKPRRVEPFLADAYAFNVKQRTWSKLAPMPRPAAAAPSPAMSLTDGRFVIFGGVDVPRPTNANHPGFVRSALLYDPKTNRWSELEGVTAGGENVVTAPALNRSPGTYLILSGERRPGVRTPAVRQTTDLAK